MKTKIEVTQEDIEKGGLGNCFFCPIALAASRALGSPLTIEVNNSKLCWRGNSYNLPEQAKRFIDSFDAGILVKPFTFEIDA